ncbi:uncharacterized protein TNCV_668181 [Trichonephila clavipes]|nr:uncharacterized protein TNCV_668181 [Trichonephila clavipes]
MVKSIARRRKWQFYGNKFTNTSKNNSTSAVPECTASCSKLGNVSLSTAEEITGPVFDIDRAPILHYNVSVVTFFAFASSKKIVNAPVINARLVYGMRHIGKDFAGAFKLCSTLNLPRLTKTAYKNQEAKILKVVQEVAEESMRKAATEIVEKKQNLSSDIVKCDISVDGT